MEIENFIKAHKELETFVSEDGLSSTLQLAKMYEYRDKITNVIETLLNCPSTEKVSMEMIDKKIEEFSALEANANNMIREFKGFLRLDEAIILASNASENMLTSLKKPDTIELLVELIKHKTEMSKIKAITTSINVIHSNDIIDKSEALNSINCGIDFVTSEIDRLESIHKLGILGENSIEKTTFKNKELVNTSKEDYNSELNTTNNPALRKKLKEIFPNGNFNKEDGEKEVDILEAKSTKDFDATEAANIKFNELKSQFIYLNSTTRSPDVLINKHLKFIDDRVSNIDPKKYNYFKGIIDLHPFYLYGWERSLINIFIVQSDMYNWYPEMIDIVNQYTKDNKENEKELFEDLSISAAEMAIAGMADLLYYVWLKEGAKEDSKTTKFKTTLTDDERLELCNKIISNNGADRKNGAIIFKDIEEEHKTTLLYLIGGDRPEEIKPIKINSHRKVYELLLSISDEPHPYKPKTKCVPDFIKSEFCPELLRNKDGKSFEMLII